VPFFLTLKSNFVLDYQNHDVVGKGETNEIQVDLLGDGRDVSKS